MLAEDRIVETGFSFSSHVPMPPERRRDERHIKILRVGTLVVDGRRELCLIRNISAGGVMAHVYSPLTPGQRVTIELKTNQPVDGRVVWVREANAGIQFDAPMDVAELLANPRCSTMAGGRARPGSRSTGWRPCAAAPAPTGSHARDISQSGVKVETDLPPAEGEEVVLTLEGFRPLHGVVRWRGEDACGIAFNQLIPFGELIAWLKRDG